MRHLISDDGLILVGHALLAAVLTSVYGEVGVGSLGFPHAPGGWVFFGCFAVTVSINIGCVYFADREARLEDRLYKRYRGCELPELTELLSSQDETERFGAAYTVSVRTVGGREVPEGTAAFLASAVGDECPRVRREAMNALESTLIAGLEAASVRDLVPRLIEELDGSEWLQAVRALGAFGPVATEALPRLERLENQADQYFVYEVRKALAAIRQDAAFL